MGSIQDAKIIQPLQIFQARSLTSLLTRFYIPTELFGLSFDDKATLRGRPELKQIKEEMVMNVKSLVPWGRERRNVAVRREEDNPFYSLQRSINQVFDKNWGRSTRWLTSQSNFVPEVESY